MNGRKAKLLRRQTEKQPPELHMSYGPNRARRRAFLKIKDRSFTRPGRQYKVWDREHKTYELRKARHIVNDFSYQR